MISTPFLQQSALDAVRQWRYQPTLLNGEPVEVDTTVDLIFSPNNPPSPSPWATASQHRLVISFIGARGYVSSSLLSVSACRQLHEAEFAAHPGLRQR